MNEVCSDTIFTGNFNISDFQGKLFPLIGQEINFGGRCFKTIIQVKVPVMTSFSFSGWLKSEAYWHILYSDFNFISECFFCSIS